MNKNISYKLVSVAFGVITILFLCVFYTYAWTEPSANPPAGNVEASLNVSSNGQSKAGGLILNTGNYPNGLLVQYGNVGIGTTTPSKKLDVVGDIQASGDVCLTSGKCLSSASGGSSVSPIKAWVKFNSAGTIIDSYNVSSVQRLSAGKYRVTWTTPFANTSYAPFVSTTGGPIRMSGIYGTITNNYVEFSCYSISTQPEAQNMDASVMVLDN
jgi:hypothetical protein